MHADGCGHPAEKAAVGKPTAEDAGDAEEEGKQTPLRLLPMERRALCAAQMALGRDPLPAFLCVTLRTLRFMLLRLAFSSPRFLSGTHDFASS
jgi:hypothetical protein